MPCSQTTLYAFPSADWRSCSLTPRAHTCCMLNPIYAFRTAVTCARSVVRSLFVFFLFFLSWPSPSSCSFFLADVRPLKVRHGACPLSPVLLAHTARDSHVLFFLFLSFFAWRRYGSYTARSLTRHSVARRRMESFSSQHSRRLRVPAQTSVLRR